LFADENEIGIDGMTLEVVGNRGQLTAGGAVITAQTIHTLPARAQLPPSMFRARFGGGARTSISYGETCRGRMDWV